MSVESGVAGSGFQQFRAALTRHDKRVLTGMYAFIVLLHVVLP